MVANTNRSFANLNKDKIEPKLAETMSYLFPIFNGLSRIGWGLAFDRVGFKPLYYAITLTTVIIRF